MIKTSNSFALMIPTDHPGYVNLRISDNGRKMIDMYPLHVYIHIPLTISLMESSDGQLVGLDLNGQFFAITGH
jgi:hypothetical protein